MPRRTLAEALAMPGAVDIDFDAPELKTPRAPFDFDPPKLDLVLRIPDFED